MRKLEKKTWIVIGVVIVVFFLICLMTNTSKAGILDNPKELEFLNGKDVSVARVGLIPVKGATVGVAIQGLFDNSLIGLYGKYPFKQFSTDSDTIGLKNLPATGEPYLGLSVLFDIGGSPLDQDKQGRIYWTPEVGVVISPVDSTETSVKWVTCYQDFRGQREQTPIGQLFMVGAIIPLK